MPPPGLTSRAVHLEVASSLDTSSCINAIRRFVAWRGSVGKIRSDNGTNLVGAQRELKEEIQKWNTAQIADSLSQKWIDWEFNPPSASHFGGVWERMIRSVRKVLHGLPKEQVHKLDDESLLALLCKVEAILNSRPLTRMSDDPNDLDALTPNHLLLGRSGKHNPPGIFLQEDNYTRRKWHLVQRLADVYWSRWFKEYLPSLQERQRWLRPGRKVAVNDVVLIVDQCPRNSWSLGRVVSTVTDKKGFAREAAVKTVTSEIRRPIHKLCLILEGDK